MQLVARRELFRDDIVYGLSTMSRGGGVCHTASDVVSGVHGIAADDARCQEAQRPHGECEAFINTLVMQARE